MFETELAAKDELRRLKIKNRVQGEAGLNIADELRVAALECTKWLEPYGKTIYDATEFLLKSLEAGQSELCSDLIGRYTGSKQRAGLTERHLYDIRARLEAFKESFGDSPIRTITAAQIEDWLYSLGEGELSARTLINWRATIHAFFESLFKQRILAVNPVSAIQKPKDVSGNPPVFTPEELEKILGAATGPLPACLAIQAFAGLRTAEVMRLSWEDVRQTEKLIHVNARIAKASRRRLVKILPNLADWLRPFASSRDKIWPTGFRNYHDDIAGLCSGIGLEWKHNGLRHSFGSYHLAKFQNADALAEQMGHVSGRIVRDYYREVVTPQSANKYWLIRPKSTPKNVVQMEAA
jgi:integrase